MKNFSPHQIGMLQFDSLTQLLVFIFLLIIVFWIMPPKRSAIVTKRIIALSQVLPISRIIQEIEKIRKSQNKH